MYAITGMPAFSAVSVGPLKAVLSISGHPIPAAFEAIAVVNAETISLTTESVEPTQEYEVPVIAQASAHP